MGTQGAAVEKGIVALEPDASEAIASMRDLLAAAALLITSFIVSSWLFRCIWHREALEAMASQPGGWAGAIAVVTCSAIVHEALHGMGWRIFARVPWRSMSIRPSWRVMGFAAVLDTPVPARAYRASAALPGVVLGIVTIGLGFVSGFGLFVLWGLFFLLECFTDLALLLALRNVPPSTLVLGHQKLGCRIVAAPHAQRRAS